MRRWVTLALLLSLAACTSPQPTLYTLERTAGTPNERPLAPVALLLYGRLDRNLILHGDGPLSRWPLWLQGIGIVVVDVPGRVVEANDAFLTMVGYTRDDVQAGSVDLDAMTPPNRTITMPRRLHL